MIFLKSNKNFLFCLVKIPIEVVADVQSQTRYSEPQFARTPISSNLGESTVRDLERKRSWGKKRSNRKTSRVSAPGQRNAPARDLVLTALHYLNSYKRSSNTNLEGETQL
nr:uncharacterized protein LOC117277201 isoform X2 [Nicotiana tomentosiformis]